MISSATRELAKSRRLELPLHPTSKYWSRFSFVNPFHAGRRYVSCPYSLSTAYSYPLLRHSVDAYPTHPALAPALPRSSSPTDRNSSPSPIGSSKVPSPEGPSHQQRLQNRGGLYVGVYTGRDTVTLLEEMGVLFAPSPAAPRLPASTHSSLYRSKRSLP